MDEQMKRQITILERLLKKTENKYCADCRRKSPSWASINIGVFLCIKCAGIHYFNIIGLHREMGTTISKVRSVDLDKWPKGVPEMFTQISIYVFKKIIISQMIIGKHILKMNSYFLNYKRTKLSFGILYRISI